MEKLPDRNIETMTSLELEQELRKVEIDLSKIVDPEFTPKLYDALMAKRMQILKRIEFLNREK